MGSEERRYRRRLTVWEAVDWRVARVVCAALLLTWAAIWLVAYNSDLARVDRYLTDPRALPEDRELVLLWDAPSREAGAMKLLDLTRDVDNGMQCQKGGIQCATALVSRCPVDCEITNSVKRFHDASIVFLHPDTFPSGTYPVLPPTKSNAGQLYACFGHEPVWKLPQLWLNPLWTSLCDMTVHWGTNADIETTFYYLDDSDVENTRWWTKAKPLEKWGEWIGAGSNALPGSESSLVSAVVSQCTSAEREEWLQAFMERIPTASYGRCEHNIEFPARSSSPPEISRSKLRMREKIDTIARHPFHLAIESTRQESGFMTEKIFQAFMAGVIPIYFGHSATVKAKVPAGSFIDVGDYDSIEALVDHVYRVLGDKELFASYHEWRWKDSTAKYFDALQRNSKYDTACRMCMYAHEHKRKADGREGKNSILLEEKKHSFGKVYTKSDGWELVNTLEKFADFERRHPLTVASVFNYTVEGSNVPRLYQPWDTTDQDIYERFSVWSYRTFGPRLVDMYNLWGIEFL